MSQRAKSCRVRQALPCEVQRVSDCDLSFVQYYAFVEEKQKVHCLNTLFSKVSSSRKGMASIIELPTPETIKRKCAWSQQSDHVVVLDD